MKIKNNRNELDNAFLDSSSWSGIKVGNDRYPKEDKGCGWYCIAGGKDWAFKATAIEFYGVKT